MPPLWGFARRGAQVLSTDRLSHQLRASALLGEEIDGKYKLLSALGQGRLGMLFEAENQLLGRKVAIRFVASELRAQAGGDQLFIDEVRAVSAIGHENIVAPSDIGRHTAFGPYAVMEYIE